MRTIRISSIGPGPTGSSTVNVEDVELEDHLRKSQHRVTEARRLVWSVLSKDHDHLTAQEILDHGDLEQSAINLSSIYRTLTLFGELGLVRETKLGTDGTSRWELTHADDAIHLVCRNCGAVDHHTGDFVADLRHHLSHGHQFVAESTEVTVTGLCPSCQSSHEPR